MTRAEHLAWCKERALAYIEIGDVQQAVTSLMSDLNKHDETRPDMELMKSSMSVMLYGNRDLARQFIEGIH